jgi:hypothetical protein
MGAPRQRTSWSITARGLRLSLARAHGAALGPRTTGNHGQQRRTTVSRPSSSAAASERTTRSCNNPDCLSHGGSRPPSEGRMQRSGASGPRAPRVRLPHPPAGHGLPARQATAPGHPKRATISRRDKIGTHDSLRSGSASLAPPLKREATTDVSKRLLCRGSRRLRGHPLNEVSDPSHASAGVPEQGQRRHRLVDRPLGLCDRCLARPAALADGSCCPSLQGP